MKDQKQTHKKKIDSVKTKNPKKRGGRKAGSTLAKAPAKRKKALLSALTDNLGIVTRACKAVGIPRACFYEWFNDDPEFKAAVEDVNEIALDFVEERHYALIKCLNTASIIFHLKTKGRGRGYVERTEIEHSGKLDTNVSELTNEQLAAIICGKNIEIENK